MTGSWSRDGDDVEVTLDEGGERVSLSDLAATDDLVERLARRRGADDADPADPAALALAELVRVVDLDTARAEAAFDARALLDRVDWLADRETLDSAVARAGDEPDVVRIQRARSLRHVRKEPRTLRFNPLTGAAAAAFIAVAGSLVVSNSLTGNTVAGVITGTPSTVASARNNAELVDYLEKAEAARADGDQTMAVYYVTQASRVLRKLPKEAQPEAAVRVQQVLTQIVAEAGPAVKVPAEVIKNITAAVQPAKGLLPDMTPSAPAGTTSPADEPAPDSPPQSQQPVVPLETPSAPSEQPAPEPTPSDLPTTTPVDPPVDTPSPTPTETTTPTPTPTDTTSPTPTGTPTETPAGDDAGTTPGDVQPAPLPTGIPPTPSDAVVAGP